jgi:uncharacterized membrane protein YeaQ/YmgE (transglycosylase-associated protein family)
VTEPLPEPVREPLHLPLGPVVGAVVVAGALLDLYCLLLLPLRLGGHLVPVAPALVLIVNALVGWSANRLTGERLPSRVLFAVTILLAVLAATRGPGGDVLVTRDLQGMYLVFIVTACVGAAVPLFRR